MHKHTPAKDEYFCDGCGIEVFYLQRDWQGRRREHKPNVLKRLRTGWREGAVFYHAQRNCCPDFSADFCPDCSKRVVDFVKGMLNAPQPPKGESE